MGPTGLRYRRCSAGPPIRRHPLEKSPLGSRTLLIELQSHSTVSDGQLAPGDVVKAAADAGVNVLALSDHDAVAGVPEAAAAAAREGIELVPAVEMSCVHEYADDLHMLGYWIDLEQIAPACERAQQERVSRAGQIVERLRGFGFHLTLEDAIAEAGDALSVGRPHLARAAGTRPEQMGAFFKEYLVPGAKAFVPRSWPTADEAADLIHDAGGVAVVAHPYWDVKDPERVATLINALDVEGVEAFYPDHNRKQTAHLLELCAERGLTPTGSSDFHGPTHKTFSRFGAYQTYGLGEPEVPPTPSS
jgi:predicted metal-dependent phosphoesterase TrpH